MLELRRRLAGATRRHLPIAWTRRCARTSSTASRKHACWEGAHHRESSDHRIYTDRSSSLISPPSSLLRPRRPSHRVRGEQAELLDPSSLSIAFHVVISVAVSPAVFPVKLRRPPSLLAPSLVTNRWWLRRFRVCVGLPLRTRLVPCPVSQHIAGHRRRRRAVPRARDLLALNLPVGLGWPRAPVPVARVLLPRVHLAAR